MNGQTKANDIPANRTKAARTIETAIIRWFNIRPESLRERDDKIYGLEQQEQAIILPQLLLWNPKPTNLEPDLSDVLCTRLSVPSQLFSMPM